MDLKQVIALHLDGTSNRKVGSILAISRNTINTYMQLFEASEYSLESIGLNNIEFYELFVWFILKVSNTLNKIKKSVSNLFCFLITC